MDFVQLLMLTTNMIRKDLNSQNQFDAGVALSALACFISPDLARDLANDIMTLVSYILMCTCRITSMMFKMTYILHKCYTWLYLGYTCSLLKLLSLIVMLLLN